MTLEICEWFKPFGDDGADVVVGACAVVVVACVVVVVVDGAGVVSRIWLDLFKLFKMAKKTWIKYHIGIVLIHLVENKVEKNFNNDEGNKMKINLQGKYKPPCATYSNVALKFGV